MLLSFKAHLQGVSDKTLKKYKKKSTISTLMGKMLRSDSLIRPRRIAAIAENQKITNNTLPIFKVNDKDLRLDITQYGYSSSLQSLNKRNRQEQSPKTGQNKIVAELEHYCEKTTLHGLRYVGDTSLTYCERIFWLMAFSVAIAFAAYYITNIYDKWISSPVIISFSPFDAQLKDIPFPAITICNMNQAKKSEVNKIKSDGNPRELKLLDDICNSNETHNGTDSTGYNWTNLRNFLIKVGNSCSDMLKSCRWSSNKKNCDDLFNNDLTDEGLCCSFNRLPPDKIFRNPNEVALLNQTYPENVYDWTPETGFPQDEDYDDDKFVPKRPLGAGAHLGLSVVLDAQVDEYYCSSTSSIGFKIIMGNPIETPKMADYGTLLSPGVEARFSIKPNLREASKNLRGIPLKKRQCYFSNERKLAYYRTYTKSNCQLECASKHIHTACGCVPYNLPKDAGMKYCEQDDSDCVMEAGLTVSKEMGSRIACNCLGECSSLSFSTKTSSYGKLNFTFSTSDLHISTNDSSYTQRNCYLECQSNYTLEKCKCIPYYLPRNKNITACGRQEQECAEDAKEDMETIKGTANSCDCLPGCFELVFSEGKSFGELSPILNATIHGDDGSVNGSYFTENLAVVHFYFPASQFTKQVKAELYGFTEILSNIGGLLGLCMGFSFLSIIEILYFSSLRLFCKWLLRNKPKKRKIDDVLVTDSTVSKYPFLK